MAFELFEKVAVLHKGIVGTIVDTYTEKNGKLMYIVQSNQRGYVDDPDAYNGEFPLYDCKEMQLAKLDI